jgi:hypothetical protein
MTQVLLLFCDKYYVTILSNNTMEHLKMTPSVEITRRHSMVFLFYVKNMVSFFVIQMLGLEAGNTMNHTMEHLKIKFILSSINSIDYPVEITRRHSMVFLVDIVWFFFFVKTQVSFFVIQMLGLEAVKT